MVMWFKYNSFMGKTSEMRETQCTGSEESSDRATSVRQSHAGLDIAKS